MTRIERPIRCRGETCWGIPKDIGRQLETSAPIEHHDSGGELLTDFKEFFAAGGGGFGVAEVETAEGIDDNFGDDEAGVFFVVGGDDIPGSGGGAGGAEGGGIGVLIVIPVAALLDVGEAEFPVFFGLVDAGEEALALFCFGEVEEEF